MARSKRKKKRKRRKNKKERCENTHFRIMSRTARRRRLFGFVHPLHGARSIDEIARDDDLSKRAHPSRKQLAPVIHQRGGKRGKLTSEPVYIYIHTHEGLRILRAFELDNARAATCTEISIPLSQRSRSHQSYRHSREASTTRCTQYTTIN